MAQVGMQTERLIVYRSRYGSTEEYALKLAQDLSCRSMDLEDLEAGDLTGLDQIIFGGPLRNGNIDGIKDFFKLVKQSDTLAKVAVWVTGVSTYQESYFSTLRARDLDPQHSEVPLFYTRGRWDLNEMGFLDRQLAKTLLRSIEKREPEHMSLTEATLSDVDEEPRDFTDYEYLEPIKAWARGEDEPGIGRGTHDERLDRIVSKKA